MQTKDLLGLAFLSFGIFGGVIATCLSKRARDVFFVLMLLFIPMTENWDVNFVSRDWYRGTVRGFEASLVDIFSMSLLISAIIGPRRREPKFFIPASFGFMLVFFLYCCVSVAISDPKLWGLFELSKMVRGFVVFLAAAFYVREERDLKILIFALALLVSYEGYLCLKQRYLWGVHRVFATFPDPNSLSVFFCMTTPILVAAFNSRLPWIHKAVCGIGIAFACVGEVLTISRAGIVTLGLVMLGAAIFTMSFKVNAKKIAIVMLVVIGMTGITVKSWETLKARFAESTLDQEYGNTRKLGRGYYLRIAKTIAMDSWVGVGLNNWSYWVSNKYGPLLGYRFVPYKGTERIPSEIIPPDSNVDMAQAAPAHNLGALTVGELGLPGLFLLGLCWLRWLQMSGSFLWPRVGDPTRRICVGIFFGLCGLSLQSLTEWVYRLIHIYYMSHLILGVLASMYFLRKRERRLAQEHEEMEPAPDELEPTPVQG